MKPPDGQFKYIRHICKTGEKELFDTRYDPEELRNVAAKSEKRATLLRLRQQLDRECAPVWIANL